MTENVAGITIPDSQLTREITGFVRDTASPLLFHHSSRVFYFAALAGQRRGLKYDPELLYCGCMFHDMGPRTNTAARASVSRWTAPTPHAIS